MGSYSNRRTRDNVLIAIFAAIIILQTWVPFLGYIALPTLSLTIIHITVIVVTLLRGTKAGVIIGAVWGINSLLRAVFIGNPIERMIFMNPLISILPRILMPLVVGLLSEWMIKRNITTKVRASALGFLGSLLNTVFVLGMIGIFSADQYLELIGQTGGSNIWIVLMSVVTLNGIPEAIVSTILTPILTITLHKMVKR
ncbi:ECF transporter S component [Aerococcaceae bacterium DSM 111176]|nr:ECF transporter S component [Aerococcaceae bacterium DSM 111176]